MVAHKRPMRVIKSKKKKLEELAAVLKDTYHVEQTSVPGQTSIPLCFRDALREQLMDQLAPVLKRLSDS